MIGWVLSLALASDPSALRVLPEDGAAVEVGMSGLSLAADLGPDLAVNVDPGAWLGVSVGNTYTLLGADRVWGMDATVAAGAAALLATPGAAITATGGIRSGARGERGHATFGIVVPAAVQVDVPPQAIVPIGLETLLGLKLGDVWLGARGQLGATLQVGGPPAARAVAAGWISVPLP